MISEMICWCEHHERFHGENTCLLCNIQIINPPHPYSVMEPTNNPKWSENKSFLCWCDHDIQSHVEINPLADLIDQFIDVYVTKDKSYERFNGANYGDANYCMKCQADIDFVATRRNYLGELEKRPLQPYNHNFCSDEPISARLQKFLEYIPNEVYENSNYIALPAAHPIPEARLAVNDSVPQKARIIREASLDFLVRETGSSDLDWVLKHKIMVSRKSDDMPIIGDGIWDYFKELLINIELRWFVYQNGIPTGSGAGDITTRVSIDRGHIFNPDSHEEPVHIPKEVLKKVADIGRKQIFGYKDLRIDYPVIQDALENFRLSESELPTEQEINSLKTIKNYKHVDLATFTILYPILTSNIPVVNQAEISASPKQTTERRRHISGIKATTKNQSDRDITKKPQNLIIAAVIGVLVLVGFIYFLNRGDSEPNSLWENYQGVCIDNWQHNLDRATSSAERKMFMDYCDDWLEWFTSPP